MGCAAVGRLTILGMMAPFRTTVQDRESLAYSTAKWKAVLKWAVGRQNLSPEKR
jgi:hypothetical protein